MRWHEVCLVLGLASCERSRHWPLASKICKPQWRKDRQFQVTTQACCLTDEPGNLQRQE